MEGNSEYCGRLLAAALQSLYQNSRQIWDHLHNSSQRRHDHRFRAWRHSLVARRWCCMSLRLTEHKTMILHNTTVVHVASASMSCWLILRINLINILNGFVVTDYSCNTQYLDGTNVHKSDGARYASHAFTCNASTTTTVTNIWTSPMNLHPAR
jgi:hypothetical protein